MRQTSITVYPNDFKLHLSVT